MAFNKQIDNRAQRSIKFKDSYFLERKYLVCIHDTLAMRHLPLCHEINQGRGARVAAAFV